MPTLPKKAVFMNLYSSNCENSAAAAAVREFHHLKKQIRGPMSERALKDMMIQAVQQLKPHDLDTRKTFTLDFLARSVVHDSWPWNIMWMEKALFPLNRQVNSYNCRIWVTENSHAIHTKALHDTGCDRTVRVHCFIHSRTLFFERVTPEGLTAFLLTRNGIVRCYRRT
ncbi:uncharacterized protein TNCV_1058561 [Trichonephila clavipes]|nr:uncharacterized protein TNCV_1058561 [Trichonephila clavipes]